MFTYSTLLLMLAVFYHPCRTVPCADIDRLTEVFVEDPEDQSGAVGSQVVFSCRYHEGGVGFRRGWSWEFYQQGGNRFTIRDNASLPHDFRLSLKGELTIPSVRLNHTGEYQCHAVPSLNCNVFSLNASLTVISEPTVEVKKKEICYNSTQNALISGEVAGFPVGIISFHQLLSDAMELVTDSRVSVSQPTEDDKTFNISISNLMTSDQGTYVVLATNSEGSSEPQHISLVVKGPDPPMISLSTSSDYVIQRYASTVRVTCSIQESAYSQDSPATISWRGPNSGGLESQSTNVDLLLEIESFEPSKEGIYTCIASNVRGMAEPKSVYVYGPISLSTPPSLTSMGGDDYQVSWVPPVPPSGVPIYEYVVYINRDGSLYLTHRTSAMQYTISASDLPAGMYDVSVAVVLGDQDSAPTGVGAAMSAMSQISVEEPAEDSSPLSLVVIVGVVVGGVVILFLVGIFIGLFFLCYYYPRRRKLSSQQQSWSKENRLDQTDQSLGNSYEPLTMPAHSELPPSPSPHNGIVTQYFNLDIDPKWEFARRNLKLSEVLCESQFTIMYKASAEGIRDKPLDVTVKALRQNATDEEVKFLFYEMDQLASLGPHPNLVSLLRVCTVEQPLYMIMEYMSHGDLLGFLRASRGHYSMYTVSPGFRNQQPPNLQLSSRDLLGIGGKVASGMCFLADRKIVHRALCCKNVLVGSGLDVKISNIGGYDLPAEVRSPLIKWCAPEVLRGDNYSTGSDVWSFGVTLWEIVTVGATPYAEINSEDLFSQLYIGMRMPRPPHCGQDVYDIMMQCWEYDSGERPQFGTIRDRLDGLAHSTMSLLDLRNYNEREYSHFDEIPSQATAL